MTFDEMSPWEGDSGIAVLEVSPALPGSEKPGWSEGLVAGVDDDLDEDESYFLEADDDEDDDYDDDYDDDFDDDDDEDEVSVETDDDEDDDL
ncbi:MAG: hypothetical protein AAGA55_10590 [Planctomycetota bacterium]